LPISFHEDRGQNVHSRGGRLLRFNDQDQSEYILLVGMVLAASPILSPSVVGIYVSIALYHSYAKLVTDRSWKREDRQEKIGLGVEAAIGDAS